MGGDTCIKKELCSNPVIKAAWSHPEHTAIYSRVNAVILDFSQQFYKLYGNNFDVNNPKENKDFKYTTQQLADKILGQVEWCFKRSNTKIFVFVMDYDPLVPSQKLRKREERKTRSNSDGIYPYPKSYSINYFGVSPNGSSDPNLAEPLDTRRLAKSSHMKILFVAWLMRYVASRRWMGGFEPDKHLIFDTGIPEFGVVAFNSNDFEGVLTCSDKPVFSGEADPRAGFWIWYYGNQGYDIILKSNDADWWCIAFNAMVQWKLTHAQCYMEHAWNEVVNLNQLYHAITIERKIDIIAFVFVFILTGNDFVFKSDHAKGIGSANVFNNLLDHHGHEFVLLHTSTHSTSRYYSPPNHEVTRKSSKLLSSILWTLVSHFNKPEQYGMEITIDTTLWNIGYWTTDWAKWLKSGQSK